MVGGQAVNRAVAIGVGCRRGCPAPAIEALVRQALDQTPAAAPLGIFTLVDKRGETGLIEAAGRLGLALTFLSREVLREKAGSVQTCSTRSTTLFGVASVAEAAALAGAGPHSVLIVARIAEGGATCAIAGARDAGL
jgi:cobalt-precorrin 5A hydrolase